MEGFDSADFIECDMSGCYLLIWPIDEQQAARCIVRGGTGPSSLLRQLCPSALSQAPQRPGNVEQGKTMIPVTFYPHETASGPVAICALQRGQHSTPVVWHWIQC